MKLDKKQIPQMVVLGVLVLACIGYVSFTVMKPPATESAPPPKPVAKADVSAKLAAAAAQSDFEAPVGTFPGLSAPIARRDPFTVQSLGIAKPKPEALKPISAATVRKAGATKLPPLIPMGNFSAASTPTLTAVPTFQDPDFVLTGVIRGAENVAIIRVGDRGRHVVKQGQSIEGRYRVLSVSEDGAVLACGNRRIHLKLGGVRNAS